MWGFLFQRGDQVRDERRPQLLGEERQWGRARGSGGRESRIERLGEANLRGARKIAEGSHFHSARGPRGMAGVGAINVRGEGGEVFGRRKAAGEKRRRGGAGWGAPVRGELAWSKR